jgi:serine/threonine protein kinase
MDQDQRRVDSIFLAALERGAAEERAAYLDSACGADHELRRRIERLLAAEPKVSRFLESPAPGLSAPAAAFEELVISERPGTVIGPYKLLQQIGEGGMGTVWMAEQTQPVQRKVALKLIKSGLDSHQVIARFEAERQALALMDHPNIAKVLDAGTTGEPGASAPGTPPLSKGGPGWAVEN